MNIKDEKDRIKKFMGDADGLVMSIVEEGALAAVEAATEATPPLEDDLSGVKTRTGMLKASWAEDSQVKPEKKGSSYVTVLRNSMPYASFVNNGHRMDKHFVPGLYINPYSGKLEYDPMRRNDVGIVVGTQTEYVRGLFMTDKAEKAFVNVMDTKLKKLLEKI